MIKESARRAVPSGDRSARRSIGGKRKGNDARKNAYDIFQNLAIPESEDLVTLPARIAARLASAAILNPCKPRQ